MASATVAVFMVPPTAATAGLVLKPSAVEKLKARGPLAPPLGLRGCSKRRSRSPTVARLFGPAIFEASKLKVLFLGVDQHKHPGHHTTPRPRTYTLTHSDVTAKLTLAISQSVNGDQFRGWYSRLQRDEVVAEWKKVKGSMSLHVHCHISGGHFLLDWIARLRFYIFNKELPVVLKAFVHGDVDLFIEHPELQDAQVWVYFHSNLPEFNRVECWGPLWEAASGNAHRRPAVMMVPTTGVVDEEAAEGEEMMMTPSSTTSKPLVKVPSHCPLVRPQQCPNDCSCCFPPKSSIPWVHSFDRHTHASGQYQQQDGAAAASGYMFFHQDNHQQQNNQQQQK